MTQADEAERFYRALKAGEFGDISDQVVAAQAIQALAESWVETLTSIGMEGQLGAPSWTVYELRLWELGEALRSLCKSKRWKGRGPLLDQVAGLLGNRKLGKGRQTLALLLGDFGGAEYASALSGVLDDPSVWGHAVKALIKAKIPGQRARVERVAATGDGWVRKAAQRYLRELGQ